MGGVWEKRVRGVDSFTLVVTGSTRSVVGLFVGVKEEEQMKGEKDRAERISLCGLKSLGVSEVRGWAKPGTLYWNL